MFSQEEKYIFKKVLDVQIFVNHTGLVCPWNHCKYERLMKTKKCSFQFKLCMTPVIDTVFCKLSGGR